MATRDDSTGAFSDRLLEKNDIHPWIVETWCIPPHTDADFVWRMEDVLQTYQLPYDARYPVVCVDEACKQWFGEVRPSQRPKPGKAARVDSEYEGKGVCNQCMMGEPLRGWRHVRVTAWRTRQDYARCVRALVEQYDPKAKKIRLVQDNLNTHDGASLYVAFPPQEARRIWEKIAFHSTPKHGSWLNMAETEIGMMNRQCFKCRLDNQNKLAAQVTAWESKRNAQHARMHWTFSLAVARQKLRKLYPSIED